MKLNAIVLLLLAPGLAVAAETNQTLICSLLNSDAESVGSVEIGLIEGEGVVRIGDAQWPADFTSAMVVWEQPFKGADGAQKTATVRLDRYSGGITWSEPGRTRTLVLVTGNCLLASSNHRKF